MAEIHHQEGEHEKALETLLCGCGGDEAVLQEAAHDVLGDFGFAYAITGRHREADGVEGLLDRREKAGYVSPWNCALLWSGRRRPAETLAALLEVVEEKTLKVGAFVTDRRLDWPAATRVSNRSSAKPG